MVSALGGAAGRRLSLRHQLPVSAAWQRARSGGAGPACGTGPTCGASPGWNASPARGAGPAGAGCPRNSRRRVGHSLRLPLAGNVWAVGCRAGIRCRQGLEATGRARWCPPAVDGAVADGAAGECGHLAPRPRCGDRRDRCAAGAQSHRSPRAAQAHRHRARLRAVSGASGRCGIFCQGRGGSAGAAALMGHQSAAAPRECGDCAPDRCHGGDASAPGDLPGGDDDRRAAARCRRTGAICPRHGAERGDAGGADGRRQADGEPVGRIVFGEPAGGGDALSPRALGARRPRVCPQEKRPHRTFLSGAGGVHPAAADARRGVGPYRGEEPAAGRCAGDQAGAV